MQPLRPGRAARVVSPLLLTLCLQLPGAALAQERDRELEDWQRRILRALEEQGGADRDGGADAYRGSAPDDGAAEAAERARKRYGGRVLAVGRVGEVYRVRLLLDSGRVVTVEVE